jgi:hypothetical protein
MFTYLTLLGLTLCVLVSLLSCVDRSLGMAEPRPRRSIKYLKGLRFQNWLGDWGFESWKGLGIFLLTTASRPALGPTQPPIQWVPGALSLVVKRSGRVADHSPPSSAEVKE